MDKDTIIRLARKAGLAESPEEYNPYWTADDVETLERFAALVVQAERERIIAANAPEIEKINAYIKTLEEAVAAEREECAKVCDKHWDDNGQHCANAIRSRT